MGSIHGSDGVMTGIPRRVGAAALLAARAPVQPRATLAAWIATAPRGIASQLRLEAVLSRYPRSLQPLVTSRQGLPLLGRSELVLLLDGLPGASAANLRTWLLGPDLMLPDSVVITEASEHSTTPRVLQPDQAT